MLPFRVLSIHGAPRSGTSWLGQIFNSHPDVAYRFQPLFSYHFKGIIKPESSRQEIERFLQDLYDVEDDEFILQIRQQARGVHPRGFVKASHPSALVMKEVRYHYVIETLLRQVEGIKVVGIVRHPCGVINSWLKTPREFKPQWDAMAEWRDAPSKNQARSEEYYGFIRWKELAHLFLALERDYSQAFYLVRYEALVARPEEEIQRLFTFCGLDIPTSVRDFLVASHQREVEDPDSVFRTIDVTERWKQELPASIRNDIFAELQGTDLEVFL
jgi:hypothetical protein